MCSSLKQPVLDRRIACALAIAVGTMGAELVAGYRFHSFALVSDGFHFATHVGVLAMTATVSVATRHPAVRARCTFSEERAHAASALAVAVATGLSAAYSGTEAIRHLRPGSALPTTEAVAIAALGFASNLATAFLLRPTASSGARSDVEATASATAEETSRVAAFGHSLLDAASSAVAILAIFLASHFHAAWVDAGVGVVGSFIAIVWAARLYHKAVGQLIPPRLAALSLEEKRS